MTWTPERFQRVSVPFFEGERFNNVRLNTLNTYSLSKTNLNPKLN
jgi:hypothetical protein